MQMSPKKADREFRLMILLYISGSRGTTSEDYKALCQSVAPLLKSPSKDDRLVAACALADMPGEQTSDVKAELLQAIREHALHSTSAIKALANMGKDALDTVPELLRFAEEVKDWPGGVYANAALETVCRLQPELRARFPEIDQRLKLEDEARSGVPPVKSFREHVVAAAKAGDEALERSLTLPIEHLSDPQEARRQLEELASKIERELETAPKEQQPALNKALELVKRTPIRAEERAVGERPVAMENLILTARILLTDEPNPNERKIETALDRFHTDQVKSGIHTHVNAESFAALSKVIGAQDSKFRAEWHRAVLNEMPWLDRVLPKPEP
jgi:hypothetical protein